MKKTTIINAYWLLLVLLFSQNIYVFGKTDYKKGYIIKNTNDTIMGFISYKGNYSSPNKCLFKTLINNPPEVFTPDELIAYRFIDEEFFVSKSIITATGSKKVFMECLIDGIVDIYHYKELKNSFYFIETQNGELLELKNEDIEKFKNGTRYSIKSKRYIGVLKFTFQDAPTIVEKLNSISLGTNSLTKITSKYHNTVCPSEKCTIYKAKPKKTYFNFGPQIGLNSFIIDKDLSQAGYYLINSDFSPSLSPSIGFFLNISSEFLDQNLSFKYENNLTKYSITSNHEYQVEKTLSLTTANINNLDFANRFSLNYIIGGNNKISYSMSAGYFINKHLTSNFDRSTIQKRLIYENSFSSSNVNFLGTKNENGFSLGIGTVIKVKKTKDIDINLSYSFAKNKLKYNNQYLNLVVGYNLFQLKL